MHIALKSLVRDTVQRLSVANRPERDQVHDLRLPARKDRAAMRSGKQAGLAPDRADFLIAAAVGAHAVLHDFFADDFLHDRIQAVADVRLAVREGFREVFHRFSLDLFLPRLAFRTIEGVHRPAHAVIEFFAHLRVQFLRHMVENIRLFGLADLFLDV